MAAKRERSAFMALEIRGRLLGIGGDLGDTDLPVSLEGCRGHRWVEVEDADVADPARLRISALVQNVVPEGHEQPGLPPGLLDAVPVRPRDLVEVEPALDVSLVLPCRRRRPEPPLDLSGAELLLIDLERGVPGQALHCPVLLAHVAEVEHDVDTRSRSPVGVPELGTGRRIRDPLRFVEDAEEDLEMGTVHRRQERPERAPKELLDLGKGRVDLVPIAPIGVPDSDTPLFFPADLSQDRLGERLVLGGPERRESLAVEVARPLSDLRRNRPRAPKFGLAGLEIIRIARCSMAAQTRAMLPDGLKLETR